MKLFIDLFRCYSHAYQATALLNTTTETLAQHGHPFPPAQLLGEHCGMVSPRIETGTNFLDQLAGARETAGGGGS